MEPAGRSKALRLIALFFVLGLFLRLAPLFRSDLSFTYHDADSLEYMQLAEGLRSGCGFARLQHQICQKPEILRTPGYPAFLALIPNIHAALACQALLGIISGLIIVLWLWRYKYSLAALAASFLIAFDMPSIVMSNTVMSETLFQFALVCALVPILFERLRSGRPLLSAIITGTLGGIAIMVRPIGVALPLLLPIPFLKTPTTSRGKRLASAAATFVLALAIPALWSLRNYRVAQFPGFSTVGAIDLYYYRAANAVARREGILLEETRQSFGDRLGVMYDHIYDANVQSAALVRKMNGLSISILKNNWHQAFAMTLQSVVYLAVAPMRSPLARMLGTKGQSSGNGLNAGAPSLSRVRDVLRTISQSPILTFAVVIETLLTIITWVGFVAALVRLPKQSPNYRMYVVYLGVMAVLLLALAAGGEADVRFRAPVSPLLGAVAGLGYFPRKSAAAGRALGDATPRRLLA